MGIRNFHWDPITDCVLSETDQAASTLVTYTHESSAFGPLLGENRNGTDYITHFDAIGSVTFLTATAGVVTDTFLYDAWGILVARTGTTKTPYTWLGRCGYQFDSNNASYYSRARSYLPAISRWASVDPLDTVVPYVYVLNNPTLLSDPSGLAVADYHYGLTQAKLCKAKLKNSDVCVCDDDNDYCLFKFDLTITAREVVAQFSHKKFGQCDSDIDNVFPPSSLTVIVKKGWSGEVTCLLNKSNFNDNGVLLWNTLSPACQEIIDRDATAISRLKFIGDIKSVAWNFKLKIACTCQKPRANVVYSPWPVSGDYTR